MTIQDQLLLMGIAAMEAQTLRHYIETVAKVMMLSGLTAGARR